jgi:LacI family transcriptional regulator
MRVTIYDLAREAGVGIGTVSRCLNNHPSVSNQTRAKVLAVVKRLNYQPHAYAQRLASRKTNTIASIIPFITNYFFLQILQGIQDKASGLGLDLILHGVTRTDQVEHSLRRSLQRGRVDGVMFFSMKLPDSYADKFRQMGLPLVLVDACHPSFDSIRVENRQGEERATSHLIQLGYRRIAMINARPGTQPALDRLAGYRDALQEAGIPYDDALVFHSVDERQDGFTEEAGWEAMKRLLHMSRSSHSVQAVVVASDIQAVGALEAAREEGIRVPEDLAVIGFDDIELARHLRLTTMRQPMYEMGVLALDRLVERIKRPLLPPFSTSFVPELIIRGTCGGVGAGSEGGTSMVDSDSFLSRDARHATVDGTPSSKL